MAKHGEVRKWERVPTKLLPVSSFGKSQFILPTTYTDSLFCAKHCVR